MNDHNILASVLHKIVMKEEEPHKISAIANAVLLLFPDGGFATKIHNLSDLIFESGMKGDNEKYEEYCHDFRFLLLNFLMYQKTNYG